MTMMIATGESDGGSDGDCNTGDAGDDAADDSNDDESDDDDDDGMVAMQMVLMLMRRRRLEDDNNVSCAGWALEHTNPQSRIVRGKEDDATSRGCR